MASAWHGAGEAPAFLAELERKALADQGEPGLPPELQERFAWAKAKAEQMDRYRARP